MSDHTIPAVEKTLSLVHLLGNSPVPVPKNILEEQLGITSSTGYRILQTLQNANWIRKTESGYTLDEGILNAVRSMVEENLRYQRLQPLLHRLSAETGLSCKFSIRRGNFQVTVLRGESERNIQVSGKIGAEFPLAEGSVGAALLADEEESAVKEWIRLCPEDIPEKQNPELLMKRIRQIREAGYTLNEKRNRWKIRAMSMPVRYASGGIQGALTLLGWDEDFAPERIPVLADILKKYSTLCI